MKIFGSLLALLAITALLLVMGVYSNFYTVILLVVIVAIWGLSLLFFICSLDIIGANFSTFAISVAFLFLVPLGIYGSLNKIDEDAISEINGKKVALMKQYIEKNLTEKGDKVYINSFSPNLAERFGGVVCMYYLNSSLCKLWLDRIIVEAKGETSTRTTDHAKENKKILLEQEELKRFEEENLR